MRRAHAFTLLELMVAIAIVALVGALVRTSLSDSVSNAQVRSTAQQVFDAVQRARLEAIKRNASVGVTVGASATVLNYATPAACTATTCITLGYGTAAGPGLSVAADAAFVFNSSGQVSDLANHVVNVTNARCATDGSCLRVEIKGGGFVKVCNPAQTNVTAPNYCT